MSDFSDNESQLEKVEKRSIQERRNGDPVSNFAWATILIWAGLVFLARNLGWLDQIPGDMGIWSIVLIGAGLIILLEAFFRMLVLRQQGPARSSLFLAVVLAGIGFGSIFGWSLVWPFILIAVGLSILFKNTWN
jgi:hypothetical protein